MNPTITTVDLGIDLAGADDLDLISLREAAQLLRGRKGKMSISTLQRFANPKRGRIFGQQRVLLPTVYRGGLRLTTREAVQAWQKKCDQLGQERPLSGPRGAAP